MVNIGPVHSEICRIIKKERINQIRTYSAKSRETNLKSWHRVTRPRCHVLLNKKAVLSQRCPRDAPLYF